MEKSEREVRLKQGPSSRGDENGSKDESNLGSGLVFQC